MVGMRLAFIGSINDEIMITEELACDLLNVLQQLYPDCIQKRYEVEWMDTPVKTLEAIAKNRGCLLKGEETDLKKAAGILTDDFRSGRLGRMTLELP